MNFRWIAALAAAACLMVACGGGIDRTKAQVRLVNASDAYPSLDLRVDGEVRIGAIGYGASVSYADVDPGKAESAITRAGSATALLSFTPPVARGRYYTVLAYGAEGALRQMLIDDNVNEPEIGRSLLRIVNAAPDAGALDVYLTGASDPLVSAVPVQADVAYGDEGTLVNVDSATRRLRITAAGNKSDLRLDVPAVVLGERQIATLVITPARGGVLLNMLLLRQRGGIEREDTNLARVRVAAGVASSGAVSATVGDTVLVNGVGSPAVGIYALLPAGTQPVDLAVNGTALGAAPVTLTAGTDYTLLVYGTPAAPAASWIEDDNRRPVDAGGARLRLVNGVAGLAAPLSMTADFVPVADGVVAGAASAYGSITASPLAQLSVTAAGLPAPLFSAVEQRLDAGAVYTVFVVGAAESAVGILRKDR